MQAQELRDCTHGGIGDRVDPFMVWILSDLMAYLYGSIATLSVYEHCINVYFLTVKLVFIYSKQSTIFFKDLEALLSNMILIYQLHQYTVFKYDASRSRRLADNVEVVRSI